MLNLFLKSSLSRILATVYFPVNLITSSNDIFPNQSELYTILIFLGSNILETCLKYVSPFFLVSSNDNDGFTYKGRFLDGGEACSIGYEASQKAHNAITVWSLF